MQKHKKHNRKQEGFVLIAAIIFVVVVGALLAAGSVSSLSNRRLAADNNHTVRTQLVAEAGIENAVATYFNAPMASIAKQNRNLTGYKTTLDGASYGLTNGTTKTITGNLDGGTYSTTIQRKDGINQTTLLVQSTGTDATGAKRVIAQEFYVSGGKFKGFDYALLSNNANCIFCHTKVDTMEAAYGSTITGTSRAKVGTLESLQIRTGEADSVIGGSLYVRGKFQDKSGTELTDAAAASSTLDTYTLDKTNGTVANTNTSNLTQLDCTVISNCTSNNNMYKNYPKGEGPDGDMPDSFPLPIPDTNGNKTIDNSEWSNALANECSGGTLTGGSIQSFATTATSASGGTPVTSISSGTTGHFIIDASTTPITINGTVCIDGDVIINGFVKGNGKIIARGNAYVVGDIEYDCSGTGGGKPCNNTDRQNPTILPKFAIASGGNTMLGDYVSANGSKTTTLLNDKTSLDTGSGKMNLTFEEMLNFNRKEVDKANANSTYVPRFYKRFPTDTNIQYYTGSGEGTMTWGSSMASVPAALLSRGPTVSLSPSWRTESQIKEMWINKMELPARPNDIPTATSSNISTGCTASRPKPFTIDGLLYSSNAIFALARNAAKTDGQLTVNGSIIAADTGMLVQGNGSSSCPGLRVHYDQRLKELFNLNNNDTVVLLHSNYRLVKQ